MIRLIRELLAVGRARRRVNAEVERRREQLVDHAGLRVDVVALARALVMIGRIADAEALLADPTEHVVAAVRRLAIVAIDQPSQTSGLVDFACAACDRRYSGRELLMHREEHAHRTTHEGRCPVGHVLPALPTQLVVS